MTRREDKARGLLEKVQESVMSGRTQIGKKKGLVSLDSHYGRMIKGTRISKDQDDG